MSYLVKRGNKFNAQKQFYNGNRYDSKKESSFAKELDLRKKAGDIKDWERQVRLDLRSHGEHVCYWKIDFKIIHNDDSIEWLETKGFETADYRIKRRLWEIQMKHDYPGSTLTIVK